MLIPISTCELYHYTFCWSLHSETSIARTRNRRFRSANSTPEMCAIRSCVFSLAGIWHLIQVEIRFEWTRPIRPWRPYTWIVPLFFRINSHKSSGRSVCLYVYVYVYPSFSMLCNICFECKTVAHFITSNQHHSSFLRYAIAIKNLKCNFEFSYVFLPLQNLHFRSVCVYVYECSFVWLVLFSALFFCCASFFKYITR